MHSKYEEEYLLERLAKNQKWALIATHLCIDQLLYNQRERNIQIG